jgi:PAS domain S-box-containing protein
MATPLFAHARMFARTAAAAVFLMGVVVLLGWTFDVPALQSIVPRFPRIVPNTAAAFVLSGFSLWLFNAEPLTKWARAVGQAAGFMVMLIGTLTLIEYLFKTQLPIDHFLFRESILAAAPLSGRMALLTAVNFVFLGLALLLFDVKRLRAWFVDILIAVPIEICLLAVIGYVCNVPFFYGWSSLFPNSAIGLHVTMAFIVLGLGLLAARPERGLARVLLSRTAGGVVARRLLLAPVIIPLATGLIKIGGQRAGFYNAEFAGWLFSFLNIFIFTAMIWWIATLLHRSDAVRRQAEEDVRRLNVELEQRVVERTAELARAKELLQEKEERLRLIIDTALDGVITIDSQGMVTGWSRQAEAMFGWQAVEILGQRLSETIIPTRYRDAHERGLKQFLATHEGPLLNRRIEVTALYRDGREFPVELAITPIRLGSDFIFSAFVRDITERKRVQAELERQRSELQLMFDTVPAIIFYKDLQHRLLRINEASARCLGMPKEKVEGRTDKELGSPHAEQYCRDEEEIIRTGQPKLGVVEPVETANGTRWLQTDKLPHRDSAGKVAGVIGFALDITERRESERKLREQLDRLDLLHRITRAIGERQDLQSIFQVVIRSLEDNLPLDFGCILLCDPTAEALTVVRVGVRSGPIAEQLSISEQTRIAVEQYGLLKCVDGQLVYEPDITQLSAPLAQRLANGGLRSVVAAPLIVGGKVFGVLLAARKESGSFSSRDREFLRQLSEHVGLAANQAQLYATLAERVRERTAELEAANKELEAFSYSVSHDLRAPLRAVSGFSSIVLQQFSSQVPLDAQRFLKEINASANEMARLIDGLLEFSRLSRQTVSRQSVNVSALVRDVLSELRKEQRDRQIEIQIGEFPDCIGDPLLLKQVFVNLLSNAIKFTRHKDRAGIEVGWREQDSESVYFVRDNGAGFDMRYADKLFGVFQRLHRNDEFEGTGVGLSIVQRIIHRHGGRIWAEGEVNKGATFYFTLPRR